jgi:PAS domain S-box-containing protein
MASLKSLYPPVPTPEPGENTQPRRQTIRPYYVLALLVLAVLALFAYLGLRQFTLIQETSSTLVNLSGRQRVLSQQATLLATMLVNENNPDNVAIWRWQLSNTIVQFGTAHDQLTQGRLPGDWDYELSPEIHSLYFNEPGGLNQQVNNFLTLAGSLLAAPDNSLSLDNPDYTALLDSSSSLLSSLDIAVSQHIREENARVETLEHLEIVLLIATLVVLMLVTIFIFYPMERHIHWEQQNLLKEIDMRKEAEMSLLRSEALYRTLAQNLPDTSVILFDRDMRYLLVEGNFLEKMGYSKEKAEGKTLQEVVAPKISEVLAPYYQRALAGETVEFERQVENGMIYSAQILPIRDDTNTIIAGLIILQEISKRKQAEAALQASQRFNERILANTPDLIYIYDVDQEKNIFESRDLGITLGYTPEQLEAINAKHFSNIMHPDDLAMVMKNLPILHSYPDDAPPLEVEFRLRDAEGCWRWFGGRNFVFNRHPDGRVWQIIGLVQDIHVRKQIEIALQQSEAQLRLAMDIASMGTWDWNLITNENRWDKSTKRLLGQPEDFETSIQNFLAQIHNEDQQNIINELKNITETGKTFDLEFRIKQPNGQVRWMYSKGQTQFDENGKPILMTGVVQDITERKLLEKQAFDMVVDREYGRVLADFIRDSSHDLRTPLSIINTSLYLLKKTESAEKRLERIQNIEDQVEHMDRLIEDMHMMSNLDMAANMQKSSIKVNQLIGDITDVYRKRIMEKGQQLVLKLADDLPDIELDASEVGHALSNLLDNALLYTPAGGTITVGSEKAEKHLVLTVLDTGTGIDANHLEYIFERFYKVDSARPTGQSGPGLGLTMVKKIVEMHGGYVEVESTPGQGSRFLMYFPLSDTMER